MKQERTFGERKPEKKKRNFWLKAENSQPKSFLLFLILFQKEKSVDFKHLVC